VTTALRAGWGERQVLRALRAEADAGDLVPFDFVELNGMRLTDPANAYTVLCEAVTGKRLTAAHAAVALEKHFSVPNPRCAPRPCIDSRRMLIHVGECALLLQRACVCVYVRPCGAGGTHVWC
jgi:hypothetical protein